MSISSSRIYFIIKNSTIFYIGPSLPPTEIHVLEIFAHNFSLEWNPPPEEAHNGIIRSYRLDVTELATGRYFTRHTSELNYAFLHLHPYYTYVFTVAAVTVSPGAPTEIVSITTLEMGKFRHYCYLLHSKEKLSPSCFLNSPIQCSCQHHPHPRYLDLIHPHMGPSTS